MQQSVVNQAMMDRFFHAGFVLLRQATRHIDIDPEVVHAGRIFQLLSMHAYPRPFSSQLVLAQVHSSIEASTRPQRRQHQLRRSHCFVVPAALQGLVRVNCVLAGLNFKLNVSNMFDENFHNSLPIKLIQPCDGPSSFLARVPHPGTAASAHEPGAGETSWLLVICAAVSPRPAPADRQYRASDKLPDTAAVTALLRGRISFSSGALQSAHPPAARPFGFFFLPAPAWKVAAVAAALHASSAASKPAWRFAPARAGMPGRLAIDRGAGKPSSGPRSVHLLRLHGCRKRESCCGKPRPYARWQVCRNLPRHQLCHRSETVLVRAVTHVQS